MDEKIFYYIDQVDRLISGEAVMPVTCEIDPTNRCQLDCSYCMFKGLREDKVENKKDLPIGIYRDLLLDLKRIGTKSITFTGGGEPTLHPKFQEMVGFAEQLGFEYGLITNGLNLHKIERPDRFKFIRVSLDAGTPETYRKLKRADCFKKVIENIMYAISKSALVGISFVVNEINCNDIEAAQKHAKRLDVAYIQFKPAWENGKPFSGYEVPGSENVIDQQRYKATDRVPCSIAGLIGIVGADARVYYCCQYRGDRRYCLGELNRTTFPEIWKRRPVLVADIGRCPNCRYMNYTRAYKNFIKNGTLFVKHKAFL